MSSNVGLPTPRGTGTSGYIQRNLSTLRPRDTGFGAPYPSKSGSGGATSSSSSSHDTAAGFPIQRQPDQDILAHERAREIEVRVFDLQDSLEDEGELGEREIEERCEELRRDLVAEAKAGAGDGGDVRMKKGGKGGGGVRGKGLKPHQVHELAEAKIKESERLRLALGIRDGGVGGGDSRDGRYGERAGESYRDKDSYIPRHRDER